MQKRIIQVIIKGFFTKSTKAKRSLWIRSIRTPVWSHEISVQTIKGFNEKFRYAKPIVKEKWYSE